MRLATCTIALIFMTTLAGCKTESGKAFVGNWIEETNSKIPAKISIKDETSEQNHFYAVKITDLIWDKETGVHYKTKNIKATLDKENFLWTYNGDNFIIYDDRLVYNGERYKRVE